MNKRVTFSEPVVTHTYVLPEEDRTSIWEQYARDRVRFLRRIQFIEGKISNVIQNQWIRRVTAGSDT